jgi:hypothetical protein
MAWLVGTGAWLLLLTSSHGLARALLLVAPVAVLAWRRSLQHGGARPRPTRSRAGWGCQAGWAPSPRRTPRRPAGWDGHPAGWPAGGRRSRRPRRPGGWDAGGAAAGATAWNPEFDPELDPELDPEFGVGIDPETGAGWHPADPHYGPPGQGGPWGWNHAGQIANGHGAGAPGPQPRGNGRASGRTVAAPDLVIATATVAGTAHLRDGDGQPVVVRVQVRGPGNLDLEQVCRQALTEVATRGNWWLEAWQPATGHGGWDGAR